LIIFGSHAKHSAFSKCFPKNGRSRIIVLHPPFHAFGSGVYATFTSNPYAMEKLFTLCQFKKAISSIIIICLPSWSTVYTVYVICVVLNCFGPRVWTA
jgi:hypothetical protein